MDGPSRVFHLTPTRIATALVVAGALSIGAPACGSGSDSTQSASVSKKQAGLFSKGVRFEVINRDEQPINVSICPDLIRNAQPSQCHGANDAGDTLVGQTLKKGQSVAMASKSNPQAEITFPHDIQVDSNGYATVQGRYWELYAQGFNPDVGTPSIKLDKPPFGTEQVELTENQPPKDFTWDNVRWVGSLQAGGDYYNITLEVYQRGPDPKPPKCLTQRGVVRCLNPDDNSYDSICQKYGGKCPPGSWDPAKAD
jgi:hypothetical protein